MKKYIYSALILLAVSALSCCGNNKTNQKLMGTEMVSGNAGGTTTQSAVAQNVLTQTIPSIFSAMSSITSARTIPKSAAPEHSTVNTFRNFVYTVGGGTLDLAVNGSYTSTYASGAGATAATENIATTFTGITVTIGGKKYSATGAGTDRGTFNTYYAVANEILTTGGAVFSFTRNGSVTISGPDCNGTWDYSLSSNGSVTLVAQAALSAPKTYSGSVTHDGVVAGLHWHDTVPLTMTVD